MDDQGDLSFSDRWVWITTAAQDRWVLYLNYPKRLSCSMLHSGQSHVKNWRPYITGVEGLTDPNLIFGMTKMWYLGYLLHSVQYVDGDLSKNSWNLKEWFVMQDLRFSWQWCWGCMCCGMWHCQWVSCSQCFECTVILQNVGIHLSSKGPGVV